MIVALSFEEVKLQVYN